MKKFVVLFVALLCLAVLAGPTMACNYAAVGFASYVAPPVLFAIQQPYIQTVQVQAYAPPPVLLQAPSYGYGAVGFGGYGASAFASRGGYGMGFITGRTAAASAGGSAAAASGSGARKVKAVVKPGKSKAVVKGR